MTHAYDGESIFELFGRALRGGAESIYQGSAFLGRSVDVIAPRSRTKQESRSIGLAPGRRAPKRSRTLNARSVTSAPAGKITPLFDLPENTFLGRIGGIFGGLVQRGIGSAESAVETVLPEFLEDKIRRVAGLPTQREVLKAQSAQTRGFAYVPPASSGADLKAMATGVPEMTSTGFGFLDQALSGIRSQLAATASEVGSRAREAVGTVPVDIGLGRTTDFLERYGVPLAVAAVVLVAIFVFKKK